MLPRSIAIALPLVLAGACAAVAAQPVRVNEFDDWGVYSYKSADGTVCYALSAPTKSEPANIDHGRNFFILAPGDKGSAFVPQAVMGYNLKPGSTIKATIGDDNAFTLFTKDKGAWLRHEGREPEMVAAMKSGSDMVLEATSSRGTATRYSYSLKGVSAALQTIAKCN